MKQRLQYYFLFIVLRIVFKLPQYRAYAYLTNESVQSLQTKKDQIAELRRLDRHYSDCFTQLDFLVSPVFFLATRKR